MGGGFPCPDCCDCPHCQTKTVTQQIQAVVTGWADDLNCTDCDESLDGTFVLDYKGFFLSTDPTPECGVNVDHACVFQITIPTLCGDAMMSLFLQFGGALIDYRPCNPFEGANARSAETSYSVTPPDCRAGNDLDGMVIGTFTGDLTWTGGSPTKFCESSGVSVTITAL